MADLEYKGIALVEQAVPAHYTSVARWRGALGRVMLDLEQNTASGVYSAHVALRVTNAGKQRSTAPGVAESADYVAALDAAVQNYLDRCDRVVGERSPRELLMGVAECAAVEAVVARPSVAEARGR